VVFYMSEDVKLYGDVHFRQSYNPLNVRGMDYIGGLSTSFSWTKSIYLTEWAPPLPMTTVQPDIE
jgi:hypothetical protein